jgi:hypothetical protein
MNRQELQLLAEEVGLLTSGFTRHTCALSSNLCIQIASDSIFDYPEDYVPYQTTRTPDDETGITQINNITIFFDYILKQAVRLNDQGGVDIPYAIVREVVLAVSSAMLWETPLDRASRDKIGEYVMYQFGV